MKTTLGKASETSYLEFRRIERQPNYISKSKGGCFRKRL